MADRTGARALTVLTRAPSSGGKRRLFAGLGRACDPALLEALLLDTLDGTAVPGVARTVAVTPASACEEIRGLVVGQRGVGVRPQAEGDLGERMRDAMAAMFEAGAEAAALVGSDLPHLTPALVAEAFDEIEREPRTLALGPAADGGYYLIAARRLPDVFSGVGWGGARVLTQTVSAAVAAGLRVHVLDILEDVDTVEGLRRAAASGGARRTAAWVRATGLGGP
jgi:hypothetical protein